MHEYATNSILYTVCIKSPYQQKLRHNVYNALTVIHPILSQKPLSTLYSDWIISVYRTQHVDLSELLALYASLYFSKAM